MSWILRLYPAPWRQRYGSEVSMLIETEEPSLRLFLDLIAGAIDARLHPEWTTNQELTQGTDIMNAIETNDRNQPFARCDTQRSAVWLLGSSLFFAALGVALDYFLGETILSKTVLFAGFPMALILSSRSTYMKSYSPAVRRIMVAGGMLGMFLFMLAVVYFAESF